MVIETIMSKIAESMMREMEWVSDDCTKRDNMSMLVTDVPVVRIVKTSVVCLQTMRSFK